MRGMWTVVTTVFWLCYGVAFAFFAGLAILIAMVGVPILVVAGCLWLTGQTWLAAPAGIVACVIWGATAQRLLDRFKSPVRP